MSERLLRPTALLSLARRLFRLSEAGFILLSIGVGIAAGLLAAILGTVAHFLQSTFYHFDVEDRLSGLATISPGRLLALPLGGLLLGAIKEVRLGTPEVMKAFSAMARAATEAGALDTKTKELIALAISVAIRCDGCVAFHSQAAVKNGATRQEIMEVMGMALYMGAGPSLMYAAQAVEAFDQFADKAPGS